MALQRRSSLSHASESRSLVDALVSLPESNATGVAVLVDQPSTRSSGPSPIRKKPPAFTPAAKPQAPAPEDSATRRGPGRPRNKRIMTPLTTTMEMGLRERVDAYHERYGATVVDIIDQAVRLGLDVWEGKAIVTYVEEDEQE